MARGFGSATAFKASLETHLRKLASERKVPLSTLQLKFVIERLLARLFRDPEPRGLPQLPDWRTEAGAHQRPEGRGAIPMRGGARRKDVCEGPHRRRVRRRARGGARASHRRRPPVVCRDRAGHGACDLKSPAVRREAPRLYLPVVWAAQHADEGLGGSGPPHRARAAGGG